MDNKREYIYRIEPGDADFMKRATLMSLADYILHTAGEDADRGGFGVRDLNLHNASWVLTRMALEVERMPAEYERIRVTTWVSAVTRAMTTRNFEVFDEKGVRIACAVTNWAMLDLSARRMLDLHLLPAYDSMTQDFPLPAALPCRLAPLSGGREYEHAVVYSDLDFNCHANSVKYIQWAVDTLPLELLQQKRFARTDINFIREARYGSGCASWRRRKPSLSRYGMRRERPYAVSLSGWSDFRCQMLFAYRILPAGKRLFPAGKHGGYGFC